MENKELNEAMNESFMNSMMYGISEVYYTGINKDGVPYLKILSKEEVLEFMETDLYKRREDGE